MQIYGILNWDNLGTLSATYTLDGNTFNQNYAVTTASPEHISQDKEAINFLYFSQDNLSAGEHSLVVTITQCQNSQYILDYVTYTPSFSSLANMPNIAPVSPVPPSSSSPSSPSSPSQNPSSPSGGSGSNSPSSAGPSNSSQSPGSPSGAASSGTPSGSSNTGQGNSPSNNNSGAQGGLQNSNNGSVRTTSSNAPIGAIVGGVVGGLIFLVLLALLFFLIWKRRSRRSSKTMLANEAPASVSEGKYHAIEVEAHLTLDPGAVPQMGQLSPVRRGFAQSDGAVSPFQDPVGTNPFAFNSGSIADLKRQRADSSSNVIPLGVSSASAQRSTSPETANATSSASMDLEYMQDEGGPPAYDDLAHRRNTLRNTLRSR